ncbi:protein ROOT PRIMORDIUM defective [Sesamum angolense]|uniref:Protein ROOT PRIMORDIUM defective n=1 Tax=Sesamum angolense TaxID=2727404 RepID=A0AAE1WW97_9LAMI|nr:protein ROOT PRIMORDIUM defective [Sesamum angolense]
MKKEPDLESALSRNRRWMVNNQIKNIILRCPNQVASIDFLQKKFKNLDLQGKALNWLKKYPCCFEVYCENDEYFCRLTKQMKFLVEEEENVKDLQEPVFVERLAKLLMMSKNQRLNVPKINELKRNFGFPDDYLLRILPKYSDMFRVVNCTGRRSSMEIELMSWNPDFAISAIERLADKEGCEPCFSCSLPATWVKSWERFRDFNSTPYISPYAELRGLVEGSAEMDKRTVALVHELLSLTLWKKVSIIKLGHFRREFCLPEKLNFLLKGPTLPALEIWIPAERVTATDHQSSVYSEATSVIGLFIEAIRLTSNLVPPQCPPISSAYGTRILQNKLRVYEEAPPKINSSELIALGVPPPCG